MTEHRTHGTIREWQIDCRLDELIGRFVCDVISNDERAEMHALQRERVDRMMPKFPKRNKGALINK